MTLLQGFSQGGEGYLGLALSYRLGTPPAAPAAPTAALAVIAGLVTDGTHVYKQTYVSALGETVASVASNSVTTVTADHGKVNLTGITAGPAGTTARRLYRSKAGVPGTFYLLATIADNTTTTYLDNTADSGLGAAGTPGTNTWLGGDPNVFVAPSRFLLLETPGFAQDPNIIEHDVYANSRDTDKGFKAGKGKCGGPLGFGLYPTNGQEVWEGAMGIAVDVPAIPSDTTASIATANGISTLVLVTGTGAYQVGQFVDIDTGTSQEMRAVMSWNAGTKTMQVAALGDDDITHSSAGTTVVGRAQTLTRFLIRSDCPTPKTNLLPRVSAEENVGGLYAYRYRGGYVGKLDLDASGAKTMVKAEFWFDKNRRLANGQGSNPNPTDFDDNDVSMKELSYENVDSFLAFESDPTGSGTSTLQRCDDVTKWSLSINNNLKEEGCSDKTKVIRHIPGAKRTVDLKFDMLNSSNRPVIYEDFLSNNADGHFFAQFVINTGTPGSPVMAGKSFYAPTVRYIKSNEIRGLTDTVGESVEAKLRRDGGAEKLYIYSI